jgi:putative ABC transport system substrate-binding protein
MAGPVADVTTTIPIVAPNVALQTLFDGLINRAQTNITGTRPLLAGAGMPERLALAIELVPVGAKVGFLLEDTTDGAAQRADAEAAAAALGITVTFGTVQNVDGIRAGAQALVDQGVNVMLVASGTFMTTGIDQIFGVARTARMPVIYSGLSPVVLGGLVGLGYNNDLTFHASAALVDRILKGANPADVPWAEIEAAWLAVNLPAAAEIGFTFPPAVVERANQVIN